MTGERPHRTSVATTYDVSWSGAAKLEEVTRVVSFEGSGVRDHDARCGERHSAWTQQAKMSQGSKSIEFAESRLFIALLNQADSGIKAHTIVR